MRIPTFHSTFFILVLVSSVSLTTSTSLQDFTNQTDRTAALPWIHKFDFELELIQTQMTQKPMLRAEVYARALRASQNRKEDSL